MFDLEVHDAAKTAMYDICSLQVGKFQKGRTCQGYEMNLSCRIVRLKSKLHHKVTLCVGHGSEKSVGYN